MGGYCHCCGGVPDGVDTACNMTGCTQSSTDGTGMSLDSNPAGGTSSLVTGGAFGRPANGFTLESTQSGGSSGTYSIILFDDPLTNQFQCLDSLTICGEFLNSDGANSLRVWPIIKQGSNVFVFSSSYTTVTATNQWTRSTVTFTQTNNGDRVTAYNSSSISVTGATPNATATTYAGFLVQARGSVGVQYDVYLDNVCVKETRACATYLCHSATVTLGNFVIGTTSGNPDPDCDFDSTDVSDITTAVAGTWLIPGLSFTSGLGHTWRVCVGGVCDDNEISTDLWLDITVYYPSADVTADDLVVTVKPWRKLPGCASNQNVGTWIYKYPKDDLVCNTPLTFDFDSSIENGSIPIVSQPSTITVEFDDL